MSDNELNDEPDVYEVDQIVDKRIQKGCTQYLVQWVGYSADDRTWEPAAHLSCPDKIHEYELKRMRALKAEKEDTMKTKSSKSQPENNQVNGREHKIPANLSAHRRNFDSGVKPHSFTGIIKLDGELHAIVKFKDVEEVEMIPVKDLKDKWPQMLIHFLEKKLVYQAEEEMDRNGIQNGDNSGSDSSEEEDENAVPDSPAAGPSGLQKQGMDVEAMDYSDSD